MSGPKIDFVCATNSDDIIEKNLKLSRLFSRAHFILQKGYTNVPRAYNDAMKQCRGDIICFLHQDVFLPLDWKIAFLCSLSEMERIDRNWAVLGIAGVRKESGKKGRSWHGFLRDRGRQWGSPCGLPAEVETLDELLLVLKNDSSLRFDENIPANHLYGADICLQARARGQKCYAILAYCHHNSTTRRLPPDFHEPGEYIKKKWPACLPIVTMCAILE